MPKSKRDELDSNIFPVFSNEMHLYVVKGSKEQKETSPIFAVNEVLETYEVCPSVSNLMLAHLETIKKSDVNGCRNEEIIDTVAEKYGISDSCLIS